MKKKKEDKVLVQARIPKKLMQAFKLQATKDDMYIQDFFVNVIKAYLSESN